MFSLESYNISTPVIELDQTDNRAYLDAEIRRRMNVFIESFAERKNFTNFISLFSHLPLRENMARLFAGVDIGSTSTKAVILDDSEKIVAYHIIPSGSDFKKSSRASFEAALEKAHIEATDVKLIVSTGYGRYITDLTSKQVTG